MQQQQAGVQSESQEKESPGAKQPFPLLLPALAKMQVRKIRNRGWGEALPLPSFLLTLSTLLLFSLDRSLKERKRLLRRPRSSEMNFHHFDAQSKCYNVALDFYFLNFPRSTPCSFVMR